MSTVKTSYDDRALAGAPVARDQARGLLGQVMGLVAVAVGFAAFGAYRWFVRWRDPDSNRGHHDFQQLRVAREGLPIRRLNGVRDFVGTYGA